MNLYFAFLAASFGGILLSQARLSTRYSMLFGLSAPTILLLSIQLEGLSPLFAMLCGVVFGLTSAVRSLLVLQLPVPVSLLLATSQSILWALFAMCAFQLLKLTSPFSFIAIACAGTTLSWLEWSILPLWGTAQNFACTFPLNRPFIALTGASGGTWSVLIIAAWFANLWTPHQTIRQSLIVFFAGILIVILFWALHKIRQPKAPRKLRVAVSGWTSDEANSSHLPGFKFAEIMRWASDKGAKLLVTPEATIQVEDRTAFRNSIRELASKYKIALAIGYFDCERRENCIDLINCDGEIQGRYVKTHLVPVFETYNAGKGELTLMDVDGVKIGGLICQDDNFPDIARQYARAGVQLLIVPTQDWSNVKNLHFASHRWRAFEFQFALARAASDGISSIIGSNGDILKKVDHFSSGAKTLVEDVPVGTGKPTVYARSGDLFPLVCGLVTLGCLIFAR